MKKFNYLWIFCGFFWNFQFFFQNSYKKISFRNSLSCTDFNWTQEIFINKFIYLVILFYFLNLNSTFSSDIQENLRTYKVLTILLVYFSITVCAILSFIPICFFSFEVRKTCFEILQCCLYNFQTNNLIYFNIVYSFPMCDLFLETIRN